MATHDYVLANQSGSSFRSDLNGALAAIVSQNSSATEPATTYSYQYWVDTSTTPELLKQRNAANDAWITLAEIGGQVLLADGTEAKPGISFASDINTGIRRSADDTIEIVTGGSDRVTVKSDGKVGIGTDDPDVELEVVGSGKFLSPFETTNDLIVGNTFDGSGGTDIQIRKARGGTGGPTQINAGDQLGEFKINGYTGSTYNTAFKIECTSSTNTGSFAPTTNFHNNNVNIFSLVSSSGIQFNKTIYTVDAGSSSGELTQGDDGFIFKTAGRHDLARSVGHGSAVVVILGTSGELRVKGDGDCENTNNSYGAISDSKLKENIVDASSQWDDIKAIQVRNYNFKAETNFPTHTQIGVVAQELETVCPRLVQDSIDEDADGNDLGTRTKTVAYSVLYMKAVKALQEAMTRIETLETKVAALEAAN